MTELLGRVCCGGQLEHEAARAYGRNSSPIGQTSRPTFRIILLIATAICVRSNRFHSRLSEAAAAAILSM